MIHCDKRKKKSQNILFVIQLSNVEIAMEDVRFVVFSISIQIVL